MTAPSPGTRVAAGLLAGALLLAVVDALDVTLAFPLPSAGLGLRAAHLLFATAETLGMGAVVALGAGAFASHTRLPRWASFVVATAVTVAVLPFPVGEQLTRGSSLALDGRFEHAIFAIGLVYLGLVFPSAFALGALLSHRPALRLAALAVALAVMTGNCVMLPDDFQGTHVVVGWGAAMFGGAALSVPVERAALALAESRRGKVLLSAAALFALLGVAVPPPNAVRCELFRPPTAIAPWILATLWRAPSPRSPVPPPPSPWLQDRSSAPPVPPTSPAPLPHDAVVVLLTVDALRADVIEDPANDALLPTFAKLKREGVYFTRASAPGTQTALSVSTLFTGRYFSELYWTDYGEGRTRHLYPWEDTSLRFPQVLSEHDVATANYAGLIFLANEWGVLRGFREEKVTVKSWRHAQAHELIDPLIKRLQHPGTGPLFLFTHLLEPHEPYDRGRKDGTDKERYLSEVAVADAQIGRVLLFLEARFQNRWAFIVSADHGEAFGEHQTYQHGKTLYEELLHVPLLVAGPRFVPRRIDTRVGLVDLGPTILDLFGLDTPPSFQGQSLVPFLNSRSVALTRPLIAECRLKQSILLPDGLKVIDDPRRKFVEAYDLLADPGETRNLWDEDPARVDPALVTLRTFFAVHTRTEGGYRVPYKP